MDLKHLVFSLSVLCIISKVLSQDQCPPLVEYMYSFDYALYDHVVQKFSFHPEDWCLARCNRDQRCRSVNYNKQFSTADNCELNSATNQQYPESYKPRLGWVYFENKIADALPPVVDGGWGDWRPWSSDCPTNCMQERKRTRRRTKMRTCTNPPSQGGGNDCSGKNIDSQICGKKTKQLPQIGTHSVQREKRAPPGSPGCLELFQTFRTTTGQAVITFELKNELFVAFANNYNISLYVFQQHNFTFNQTLDTVGARDVEYFTVHGDHFLAVANAYNSVVYRCEAGKFNVFQRIPTSSDSGTHYFKINTRNLISFSNYYSSQVSIYEWTNETFSNKIQDIQITKPIRCNTFTIHNITYIACGSGFGANTVTVLKWSGKQFEPFQDLDSTVIYDRPHTFLANGNVYLAIANYITSGFNYDIDSYIYRWNGAKFVLHQSIPTHGAMGWDSFTTGAGEVFLVVANYMTYSSAKYKVKSSVYKMADNKFNLYQQLPTTGAYNIHAFTHKEKQCLAVVNRYEGRSYNRDSPVYIWN